MKYTNIFFLQGEEAKEALNILDKKGHVATFNFLQEWNYGESEIEENNTEGFTPWGSGDRLYRNGNFVMSYNFGMGYIGLTEIVES